MTHNNKRRIASTLLALAMTASGLPSTAGAEAFDGWQFQAVIYGYLPDIGGKTTFPAGVGGSDINVDASTIIENLKFVFMGNIEARKDRWGLFTDLMYLDVGGSKSQSRDVGIGRLQLPAGVTADLNLDLKGTIWTLAGTYRISSDPSATFDVLAGARLADVKQNLGWQFSADLGPLQPSRSGNSEVKVSVWDGIVGMKGRFAFGERREWVVPYYADVGTGNSDLTWQVFGGIGYSFHWGDVIAGWRYLDYKFKSGARVEDLNFNGPLIGAAFRW